MNLSFKACVTAGVLGIGVVAHAAPPTVVPSPGYDARLQEQRAATAKTTPPEAMPAPPRRHKKPKMN